MIIPKRVAVLPVGDTGPRVGVMLPELLAIVGTSVGEGLAAGVCVGGSTISVGVGTAEGDASMGEMDGSIN